MPNIGPLEVVIVLVIVLLVFGPRKLPELGRSLGRGIREARGTISEVRGTVVEKADSEGGGAVKDADDHGGDPA